MKRYGLLLALGISLCAFGSGVSAQQVPGRGFSALLCLVEQGPQPGNAQVSVSIESDSGPDVTGVGTATVTITHGDAGSTHTIVYRDANGTGHLDCGDIVLSVS